ncbi:hypothetical protein BJX70DRAFT_45343 [Aspergillus crustosus]
MQFPQRFWVLAASLGVIANAVSVVEVDLVFPRNETYAPTKDFPIVFAFQNAEKAELLNPKISYTIINWNNFDNSFARFTYPHDLKGVNWSSNNPYLSYLYYDALKPGQWWLTWRHSQRVWRIQESSPTHLSGLGCSPLLT